jgi:hypothetical protein
MKPVSEAPPVEPDEPAAEASNAIYITLGRKRRTLTHDARRKRERLPSSGSIESDPGKSPFLSLGPFLPVASDTALTHIGHNPCREQLRVGRPSSPGHLKVGFA